MDFLDPKAKKAHKIRLTIGYILVIILIVTSTLVLVYAAGGYGVDRKTGQVIQNGLVYIDSAPDGAELYLNGELYKSRTNVRMTLPQGVYDISIRKEGYRDWNRTITVKGGTVERITYPMLILQDLAPAQIDSYGKAQPNLSTQSPDRRWLMVAKPGSYTSFTEYDLNNLGDDQKTPVKQDVNFQSNLFTSPAAGETEKIELIEWSNDNENFLVKHSYGKNHEFVLLNRDNPGASLNLTNYLGVKVDEITLRDKKADRWYLFTKQSGTLQTANPEKQLETVVSNITAYKTHDASTIVYAVKTNDKTSTIYIRQGDTTYNLRTVTAGTIKLNIARYDGAWYVAVGSSGDKRTYVYKNPVAILDDGNNIKPAPAAVLKAGGVISDVAFSTNTRFIMAQSGQNIGVYDAEKAETYGYTLVNKVDKGSKVSWMDGHRLQYRSGGFETIVDFDGSNSQKLVTALTGDAAFFDRDYTVLYTLSNTENKPVSVALFSTDLRTEADK